MGVKDHKPFYPELGEVASQVLTPNTVSRGDHVGDRAFTSVVVEAGNPVLDREFNLMGDAAAHIERLLRSRQTPSGWLRGQTRYDCYGDYTLAEPVPPAIYFDPFIPQGHIDPDSGMPLNSFILPRLMAHVAGQPVVVEFTNTSVPNANFIVLEPPSEYSEGIETIPRTDFVFLEVWKALVAPSPRARGWIRVVSLPAPGAFLTLDAVNLTAVAAAPAANQFLIGANVNDTAQNIGAAINNGAGPYTALTAQVIDDTVLLYAAEPGVAGNAISLASSTAALTISGAFLALGEDRPNKPSQSTLFRHGNTLAPTPANLPDELTDPILQSETTQRVQLQYRIRVTGPREAVNFKKHPDGFSTKAAGNPTIFAQGGRNAPVLGYTFQRADGTSTSEATAYETSDDGLWIAGLGDETSAQELGTVDGFVYAIPLCFVFRHHNGGFQPTYAANGALEFADGPSDRPDGEFSDVITQNSLLDLRRHVSLTGFDYAGELQFQMQSLLDGSLRTWAIMGGDKEAYLGGHSADVSTRFLVCNEVGRDDAHNGAPPGSGELTQRGTFIRNFDHIARRFGSQPVNERVVFSFYPGDRAVPPAFGDGTVNLGKYVVKAGTTDDKWAEDDVLHLDLDLFNASTLGNIFEGKDGGGPSSGTTPNPFIGAFMPPGTVITDVLTAYHDDGNYTTPVDQRVQVKLIKGVGSHHLEVTLDANDTSVTGGENVGSYPMVESGGSGLGSPRRIFLEVEVSYPVGVGTTCIPDVPLVPDPSVYDGTSGLGPGALIENAGVPGQRPNDLAGLQAPRFRAGYREVRLGYVTDATASHEVKDTNPASDQIVSRDAFTLYPPRRVDGVASVFDTQVPGLRPVSLSLTEFGSSSRKVVLEQALSGPQTLATVQYYPQDAIPNYGPDGGGYQISVYYRSFAPQTAGTKEGAITTDTDGTLPTILRVEPLLLSDTLWTGQASVGSVDPSFPYTEPLTALPINDGVVPTGTTPEWALCATAQVTIGDFDADTGLLSLHPLVPADGQNILELGGLGADEMPRKDLDFRAFYPFADDAVYRPTILAQPLFGSTRHKVFTPFLVRAVQDVPGDDGGGILWRKNELLLVVLTRYAELDEENTVRFVDPQESNRTCAGVYRTRNLLLVVGDGVTALPSPPPPT